MMLLHGNLMCWRQFEDLIPLLERKFCVYAVSFDGFDGTGKTTYTTAQNQADKLAGYIEKELNGRLDLLFAESLGCGPAVFLKASPTVQIDRMILSGPEYLDFGVLNRLILKVMPQCSATSFLRNWDSILEKKRANLRSISEPARLRQPPPRSTGAAHARGRAQSIREERRIAAPPVLFALLWVRLLPALYGPFCGPLRPFGGCPWGVTPPARECLPPAPPDTRRRG